MIKAAVSRQREFLADAAAVQFTRNPDGLTHALLEIHERSGGGSRLQNHRAEEVSHMGFGRTVGDIAGLTATHPPIKDRMAALGPKYEYWYRDGERIRRREQREAEAEEEATRREEQRTAAAGASEGAVLAGLGGADAVTAGLSVATLEAIAGSLDGGSVARAHALLRRLPEEVLQAVHTQSGAEEAVIVLSLLAHAGGGETGQRATAHALGMEGMPGAPADAELLPPSRCRPKVVTRALTALNAVQPADKRTLLTACTRMISADDRVRASEAELLRMFAALLDTPVPTIVADPD